MISALPLLRRLTTRESLCALEAHFALCHALYHDATPTTLPRRPLFETRGHASRYRRSIIAASIVVILPFAATRPHDNYQSMHLRPI